MPRRPPVAPTNGHGTSMHCPGVYQNILEKRCERDALIAARYFLTLANDEVAEWERENAERKAALIRERDGQPLTVNSSDLPHGLPPPFDHKWSGKMRRFTVDPTDTITLRELEWK